MNADELDEWADTMTDSFNYNPGELRDLVLSSYARGLSEGMRGLQSLVDASNEVARRDRDREQAYVQTKP